MYRSTWICLVVGFLTVFASAEAGWAAQGFSKALEVAMRSKGSSSLDEVSLKFHAAVAEAGRPAQQVSTLLLLADYLMEERAWGKAIDVYAQILELGEANHREEALYGMAKAYLAMGEEDQAKQLCADLIKANRQTAMLEHSTYLAQGSSRSLDARLAEFLKAERDGAPAPAVASLPENTGSPDPAKEEIVLAARTPATQASEGIRSQTAPPAGEGMPIKEITPETRSGPDNATVPDPDIPSLPPEGSTMATDSTIHPLEALPPFPVTQSANVSAPTSDSPAEGAPSTAPQPPARLAPTPAPASPAVDFPAPTPISVKSKPPALADLAGDASDSREFSQALEAAMKTRARKPVAKVVEAFEKAIAKTGNPSKKATSLFLLADHLMKKKAWDKAFETYLQILVLNIPGNREEALQGMARAKLALGEVENAQSLHSMLLYPAPTGEAAAPVMASPVPENRLPDPVKEEAVPALIIPSTPGPVGPALEPLATMPDLASFPTESPQPAPAQAEEGKMEPFDPGFSVQVGGWKSGAAGTINARGMSLGLDGAVDVESQTILDLSASYEVSETDRLRLSHARFEHSGTLAQTVTYDNKTFTPGSTFDLKTRIFDVEGHRRVDTGKRSSWGPLYGMRFANTEMEMVRMLAAVRRSGTWNMDVSSPYLGVESQSRLSANVSLNGSAKFLNFGRLGNQRTRDLKFQLLFGPDYGKRPARVEWHGFLGFRDFQVEGSTDDDTSDIRYSGPVFGLTGQF